MSHIQKWGAAVAGTLALFGFFHRSIQQIITEAVLPANNTLKAMAQRLRSASVRVAGWNTGLLAGMGATAPMQHVAFGFGGAAYAGALCVLCVGDYWSTAMTLSGMGFEATLTGVFTALLLVSQIVTWMCAWDMEGVTELLPLGQRLRAVPWFRWMMRVALAAQLVVLLSMAVHRAHAILHFNDGAAVAIAAAAPDAATQSASENFQSRVARATVDAGAATADWTTSSATYTIFTFFGVVLFLCAGIAALGVPTAFGYIGLLAGTVLLGLIGASETAANAVQVVVETIAAVALAVIELICRMGITLVRPLVSLLSHDHTIAIRAGSMSQGPWWQRLGNRVSHVLGDWIGDTEVPGAPVGQNPYLSPGQGATIESAAGATNAAPTRLVNTSATAPGPDGAHAPHADANVQWPPEPNSGAAGTPGCDGSAMAAHPPGTFGTATDPGWNLFPPATSASPTARGGQS